MFLNHNFQIGGKMSLRTLSISTAILSLGLLPHAALAAPILSEVGITIASGNLDGTTNPPQVQEDDEPTGGTVQIGNSLFGNFAIQEGDGNSDVRAVSQQGGFLADFEQATSAATFTQQETNTTNATRQFFLNYTVQNLEAELNHFADDLNNANLGLVNPFGATPSVFNQSGVTAASFEYTINVNGVEKLNTRVDALVSDANGIKFEGVGDFLSSASFTNTFSGEYDVNVGGISGEIILGDFDAGETLTVTSSLVARAFSHAGVETQIIIDPELCDEGITVATFNTVIDEVFVPQEECSVDRINGTFLFLNDPVTITSIGNRAIATNPSPVPLPAAAWMLIAALGGLGAVRSRKA